MKIIPQLLLTCYVEQEEVCYGYISKDHSKKTNFFLNDLK